MVHLDYRDGRPIYIQIVDGFREQILAGVLQPGEKLPSVRELAYRLKERSHSRITECRWVPYST